MPRAKRTCLKFVGYIYLPKDEDISTHTAKELLKKIDYHKEHRNGRLKIYDDYNNSTTTDRDIVFDNFGDMVSILEEEYRKRSNGRLKDVFNKLIRFFP